jgi:hypothetical protein
MKETEFLIGRSGLDLVDDFYPDDLPGEWRFDYYSTQFKTLCLPIDTKEDLELIFEELADTEEEFELVLSITSDQLANVSVLKLLLATVADYKKYFVLFCELDKVPNDEIMLLLKDYQCSFQADKKFNFAFDNKLVAEKYLYYNHIPVLYTQNNLPDKQMRAYIEQVAIINMRTIIICKNFESKALNKVRIIAELLGF